MVRVRIVVQPILVGRRQTLVGRRQTLVGHRPTLVGRRPTLVGRKPNLVSRRRGWRGVDGVARGGWGGEGSCRYYYSLLFAVLPKNFSVRITKL